MSGEYGYSNPRGLKQPTASIAPIQTPTGQGDTVACLRAMAYLNTHQWLRRLRGLGGKPWELLGFTIAVLLVAVWEVLALQHFGTGATLNLRPIDPILRFVPLLLPFLLWRSAGRSPLRLRIADVSWLLTAPGGPRAVIAWKLLLRPLAYAFVAFLGTVLARWWLNLPVGDRWKVVLIGAIVGLTIRLVSVGGHILAIRIRAATAVRIISVIWGLGLLASAVLTFPGSVWLDLRPITERLVAGTLDPAAVSGGWLLTILAILLVLSALVITGASGLQERAENAARQGAHAQEALRTRSGREMWATMFRSGVPSLPTWSFFAGDRALCYRALAQERRIVLSTLGTLAVLLAIAVGLRLFFPPYAWVPAALTLVTVPTAFGAADGLAAELDHYQLRLAPFRPLPALIWVSVIPIVRLSLMLEVLWLPAFAAPGIPTGVWIAIAMLIPFAVTPAALAGSFAIAVADSTLSRAGLGIGLAALGVIPAVALLELLHQLVPAPLLIPLGAAALLAPCPIWLAYISRRVWAPRTAVSRFGPAAAS